MSGAPEPLEAADVLAGAAVEVGGLPFRLHAGDARRADAVASLLRHAPRTAAASRCTVRFAAAAVDVPDAPPAHVVDDVELWRPEPATLVLRSPAGLSARATADDVVVGGDAPSLLREFRFMCSVALTHLLAQHGRHVLHGGAVVVDGRALLILGSTATGKSTLVYAALRHGWRALADDLVAVHRDVDVVHAMGVPRPIAVPADVDPGERRDRRLVPDDPRGRTELPGSTLAGGVHPVAGVVITSRGSERETEVAPLDAHQALRTVLEASASVADPLVLPRLFAVAGALARLPAWTLRHGTDPSRRLDGAGRRLEELRSELDLGSAP